MSQFFPDKPLKMTGFDTESQAKVTVASLLRSIQYFESKHAASRQILCRIVTPDGRSYLVHRIGATDPALIEFHATNDKGDECFVVCPYLTFQMVLEARDLSPGESKKPIGFQTGVGN